MRRIIVVNAKGGCGKTTVATNLAAAFAARGFVTALLDHDAQSSSLHWLHERPSSAPRVHGVAVNEPSRTPLAGAWQLRIPRDTQRVVVDTQAGVRACDLMGRLGPADTVLVPVLPSAIDMRATADFVRDLLLVAKLRPDSRRLAIVINRARRATRSLQTLERFLENLKIPVIAQLRDTQHYVASAERGLGVHELPVRDAREDAASWQAIVQWLEEGVNEKPAIAPIRPAETPAPHQKSDPALPWFLAKDASLNAVN